MTRQIGYGGDHNPEQWPREVWDRDHDAGVAAVVRAAPAEHGLPGPLADVPEVEVTERVSPDGTRHLFVLNHGPARRVSCPVDGTDLLDGRVLRAGEPVELDRAAVLVLRQ